MASHPFNIIIQQLTKLLTAEESFLKIAVNSTPGISGNDEVHPDPKLLTGTYIHQKGHENSPYNSCECKCLISSKHHYILKKKSETDRADGNFKVPSDTFIFKNSKFICDAKDKFDNIYLRTSLLESIKFQEPLSEKWFHSERGPVFRKCLIKTDQLPVQYQKLIVWPYSWTETNPVDVENGIAKKMKETTDTEDTDTKLKCYEVNECQLQTGHMQENPPSVASKIEKIIQILKSLVGGDYNIQFRRQWKNSVRSEVLSIEKNIKHGFKSLGYFVIVLDAEYGERLITLGELSEASFENRDATPNYLALLLFLDDIASIKFDIRDKRLLYSSEKRVISQMIQLPSIIECKNDTKIRMASLYPMTFVHDMSFWENEEIDFDETQFCNVIRDIADDTVVQVELIDSYRDPATLRHSRCYRMTFQSPDKALCYDTSWKLQSLIRLEVQRYLKIELR